MESISPNKHDQPEAEFDKDRQDEFLLDAIGDIKVDQCEHTPDLWQKIDHIDDGDQIVNVYKCKCGKTVEEIFALSDTRVSE